jgi:serine/threonine protein kinase
VAGKYQVLRALGHGSLGTVYLCQQVVDGRLAALKVPSPQLMASQVFRSQFWLELVAAGRLYAPNVVPTVEFGEDVALGTYYVAMPYVPHPDLGTVLRGNGVLPAPRSADIIGQVLEALASAHEAGIVHLNLKPSNVFVQLDGAIPGVLVGDFGCSRLADPAGRIGTPSYSSPEQALGLALDSRSDIYSVGVMLYELLAGQLPFEAASAFELARLHCGAPPPPPSGFRAIPPELEGVCLKALSKTPAARYQSAEEMRAALADVRDRLAPHKRARRASRDSLGPSTSPDSAAQATIPKRRKGLLLVIAAGLACAGWAGYSELADLRSSAPHTVAISASTTAPPRPLVQLPEPEAGQSAEYGVLEVGELGTTPSLPTWPTSPVPPLTPSDAYVPVPGAPFGAAALYGARPDPALAAGAE